MTSINLSYEQVVALLEKRGPYSLQLSPIAEIFPMMEGDGASAFCTSIAEEGVRRAIVLLPDHSILDGRNRYFGAKLAGFQECDLPFRYFGSDPTDGIDPIAYVLRENLHRRHLTDSQRAAAVSAAPRLVQGARTDLAEAPGMSQAERADIAQVSKRLVESADTVRDHGVAGLFEMVRDGEASVSAAAEVAQLPVERQREILAAIKDSPNGKRAFKQIASEAHKERQQEKKERRGVREKELGAKIQALPQEKFGVILADPEWEHVGYSKETGLDRAPDNHYTTSPLEVIMARPVASIAAPDCVLGIWCTDLSNGLKVMAAWGFDFKSYQVWVKDVVDLDLTPDERALLDAREGERGFEVGERRILIVTGAHGLGRWNLDRDEIFLIGTRGHPVCPAPGTQDESVWFAARPKVEKSERGQHSAKPENAHLWFEKHFPNTPKIELNARKARPGWKTWGNEAPDSSTPEAPASGGVEEAGGGVIASPPPATAQEISFPSPSGKTLDQMRIVEQNLRCAGCHPNPVDIPDDLTIPFFLRRAPTPEGVSA